MASDERVTDARVAVLVMQQDPASEPIPAYTRDLNAAWRVAERVKHPPLAGSASLRQSLRAAWAFDDLMEQIRLLELPPEQVARFICEAALVAIQES